jgi:3-keto-disaccharide hydrolase
MKRLIVVTMLFFGWGLTVDLTPGKTLFAQGAWKTLLDGKSMDQWTPIGMANWRAVDGAIQSDNGMNGFLVSQQMYGDFELRAEFWVTPDANSGIFIRGENAKEVTAMNAYEVNIFDMRPDQAYRTGGIVDVAKPMAMMNAGNQWNTFEITAKGPQLTVRMNNTLMVDTKDTKHARGIIALQAGAGTVKFRKVEIR